MSVYRLVCFLILAAGLAYGQFGGGTGFDRAPTAAPEGDVSFTPTDTISRERKEPNWWRRAKYPTPARQLAYAKELEEAGKAKAAAKAYNAVVHRWHDTDEGVLAQTALADLLFERGKLDKAFAEYQYLVDHYPGSFPLDRTVAQQLAIAKAVLAENSDEGGWEAVFDSPEVALPMFERIVENAPQWAETPAVRFARGKLLEKLERYSEAVKVYEALEQRHPRSEEAAKAAYSKTVCLMALADKSLRDEKLCRRALSACDQYLSRHRGAADEDAVRARATELRERIASMAFERARYYDETARLPAAARVSYESFLRDFPFSAKADVARARLAELDAVPAGPKPAPETQSESGAKQ